MRKKTMKNDIFYIQYPYRPELDLPDNRQLKYKVATSFDSRHYYTCFQTPPRVLCEPEQIIDLREKAVTTTPPQTPTHPLTLERSQSEPGDGEIDDEEEEVTAVPDNQTLLRMLEDQEKITHMFRCARIQGKLCCHIRLKHIT